MRYLLLAVFAFALIGCATKQSKPTAESDVVVVTSTKAAPQTVQAAPPPPPSPQPSYEYYNGSSGVSAQMVPPAVATKTCWDGSVVSSSGQCPSLPSSGIPSEDGKGLTFERVVGLNGIEEWSVVGPDGTVLRKFTGTEAFEKFRDNPYKVVADAPVSTFSSDVDTASYTVARSSLTRGSKPPKDSVRVEEFLNYFTYDYDKPKSRQEPFKSTINIAPSPWNDQTKLIHIGVQGYTPPASQRPPMNLVFLVDTSGSMNTEKKLPLLKKSFDILLDKLEPEDRVSIVTYGPRMETVLVPTPGDRKADIRAALEPLQAVGGTNGEAGLQQAYRVAEQSFIKDGTNRVILATDGDFNIGIKDPGELKRFVESKRDEDIYISVLGYGRGNLKDARMQALAQNGNGVAYYIDTLNEAKKVLGTDFSKSLIPIADDLKIQVEFNPALVSEYRLIGYETRALARQDFNNDKVDAGDIGSGHSVTAIYEIVPVGASAGFVDPLRYGSKSTAASDTQFAAEYGFLKLRYKRPGENISSLVTTPILKGDEVTTLARAPRDTRWAVAVAGLGMTLREDQFAEGIDMAVLKTLAGDAEGRDRYGYRAEFLEMMDQVQDLTP